MLDIFPRNAENDKSLLKDISFNQADKNNKIWFNTI